VGGLEESATGMLSEMSKPVSWSMPADKICMKLYRRDEQICDLRYGTFTLWLLLATELSVLLDRGYGTVCRAMSLNVRLSLLFVENSNISFLVCAPR